MPDPVTPTDQTGPLDAGHTTTEYAQSKAVVILSSIIAVLGVVTSIVEKAAQVFPDGSGTIGKWIAIAGVAVAGLTTIAYTGMRAQIKVNAIRAGVRIAAPNAANPSPSVNDAAANLGK